MTRKADPPSRRPSRRKPTRRPPASALGAPMPGAAKARAADDLDCDFGLAFSVVPALRRPPDA